MRRKLGLLVTIVGTVLAVINGLSPQRVNDLRLGFGIFLLKQFGLELVIIGLLLLISKSTWKRIALIAWDRFPKFDSRPGKENVISLLMLALIFLVPVVSAQPIISETVKAVKLRIFFMRNLLYRSYRQELLQSGVEKEKLGETDKALSYYRTALEISPDNPDNYAIRALVKERQGMLLYAGACLESALTIEKKKGLTRQSFYSLAQSFRLCPGNNLALTELQARIKKLKEAKDAPIKFSNAYFAKLEPELTRLFQEWKWYLFDDDILKALEFEPSGRPRRLNINEDFGFVGRMSAEEFQGAVEKSWGLESIQTFVSSKKSSLERQVGALD
jgi:tetratricopeptide (TPR) repeat protein